jgi:hypothetical protein
VDRRPSLWSRRNVPARSACRRFGVPTWYEGAERS